MFSGKTQATLIDQIIIARDDRQRKHIVGISDLAHSFRTIGQINPIIIDEDYNLVAGERRLTAAKECGWSHVTTQFAEDCTKEELFLIELEENLKRHDLTWQETCKALYDYHNIQREANPEWLLKDTAESLGVSASEVSDRIRVHKAIITGVKLVKDAPKYSTARSAMQRQQARASDNLVESISFGAAQVQDDYVANSILDNLTYKQTGEDAPDKKASVDLASLFSDDEPEEIKVAPARTAPILLEDFREWGPVYEGTKFNFLHCDFPYGIDAGSHKAGAAKTHGGYEDGEDIYWELIRTLAVSMDNLVAPSAHMMFWFSMDYYQETMVALRAMGWTVNPFPLYWVKSCNTGIMPDPKRGPRRITETALLCTRGDRLVAQPVANATSLPATKEFHMSEKPKAVLAHFFRMFVDDSTIMLDPTAGSANAVVQAQLMGAKAVLGLEQIEDFHASACKNFLANT